jgi:hypothetical protein
MGEVLVAAFVIVLLVFICASKNDDDPRHPSGGARA